MDGNLCARPRDIAYVSQSRKCLDLSALLWRCTQRTGPLQREFCAKAVEEPIGATGWRCQASSSPARELREAIETRERHLWPAKPQGAGLLA